MSNEIFSFEVSRENVNYDVNSFVPRNSLISRLISRAIRGKVIILRPRPRLNSEVTLILRRQT